MFFLQSIWINRNVRVGFSVNYNYKNLFFDFMLRVFGACLNLYRALAPIVPILCSV